MRFTDTFVRSLQAKPARYDVREASGEGFSIRVWPTGTKTFQTIYTVDGKKRRLTHGDYPSTTLSEARQKHRDARRSLDRGEDPKARQEPAAPLTVRALGAAYLEGWAKPEKKTWEEDQRYLEKEVYPELGEKLAAEVTKQELRAIVRRVTERGSPVSACRLYSTVHRMWQWALEVDLLSTTPFVGFPPPPPPDERDRVLTTGEIRAFWNTPTRSRDIHDALRLTLLTAQRPGEIRTILAHELDGTWWTIPAGKGKRKTSHRVPLTPLAVELLGEWSGYRFPSPTRLGAPVVKSALSVFVQRHLEAWGAEDWHPHDLRRTAASYMGSIGVPRLVISKVLGHAEAGITWIYDRHSYDAEKREALEAWEKRLREIVGAC